MNYYLPFWTPMEPVAGVLSLACLLFVIRKASKRIGVFFYFSPNPTYIAGSSVGMRV